MAGQVVALKFEKVVDDDPATGRENWPSAASWRAQSQPRCLNGHFIRKSSVKTHWPRDSVSEVYYSWLCPTCEARDPGTGDQTRR